MTNFLAAAASKLSLSLKTTFALVFCLSFSTTQLFADTFTTVQAGNWTNQLVWASGKAAPTNINNKDQVEVNHVINTGNVKINNGGIIVIGKGGDLTGQALDLNGPASQIVIEPGGALAFSNFVFDNKSSTSNVVITNRNLSPLPVTLLYFEVKRNFETSTGTTLEWKTASEKNNAYFAVEKSLDGKTFTEAGRVIGKNAATGALYSFEDKNPASRAYYRLKQVDFDGTTTYSGVIVAVSNRQLAVHGRRVMFEKAFSGKLHLVNLAGVRVKTLELSEAATYEFPASLQGIFLMQLEEKNLVTTQRISL